ncbi:MAG: glycoside hydrolase family 3 C-terminal domain-containing protein [Clostridia bacterium]|nr:glycoside hydrolase family 3 C-terminal domain-containing protein [Clostridia bacterium]
MINVDKLLSEMTLEEKVCLLSGHKSWFTNKVSRVGLPSIMLTDGPHGLRKKKAGDKVAGLGQTEPSTCFPAACTTGASWNKLLLYKMGNAMGEECRSYGVNLILGPAVNIKRNPLCGRNFEYFSEDPLITGLLGSHLTLGIEDMGVGTSVKHFACNNNEANRYFGDSIVDERAFREIYLKAFEPIIKDGKPATVMCAYNKVNGKYASENSELLNDILRDEWGFEGLVMSDWGAVNDRVEGLKCGLDLEMPGDIGHNRQVILDAVKNGELSEEVLDRAVLRVLRMIRDTSKNSGHLPEKFEEHAILAKEISTDSAVLMKNEGKALPLDESGRYFIVGDMFEKMRYQGAGSSLINPYKLTTPKDSFDAHGVKYEYARGYDVDSFDADAELENTAIDRAKSFDTIIFFGGLSEYAESEGFDRKTLSLPENQIKLLDQLHKLGKKIIFVMFGGSPVDTDFDHCVDALLNMYLPGEAGGEAAYELLFGKVNPSGRLPESWPDRYSDVPFGGEFTKTTNDRYKESIFVGYRYYSSFNIPLKYPFGFGLSYTDFEYSNMQLCRDGDMIRITAEVENIGNVSGATVAQIYVNGPHTDVVKPVRELCGFEKIYLEPGERSAVHVDIPVDRLRYFINGAWRLERGVYNFELCSDATNALIAESIEICDGEKIDENQQYRKLYGNGREELLTITDEAFDTLIGRKIASPEIKRPYDLNTPMREYKTAGGKFLFGLLMFVFKRIYLHEKRAKPSPDKETKVKNAYFGWHTIASMSLRSISYASEGMLSHKMALVLLDIANNRPLRAVLRLFKPEKCVKLPD